MWESAILGRTCFFARKVEMIRVHKESHILLRKHSRDSFGLSELCSITFLFDTISKGLLGEMMHLHVCVWVHHDL